MKQALHFLKILIGFFLLAVSLFLFWSLHDSKDIPDRAIWTMLISFAFSLTILWAELRGNVK
jgi:O-antigen/teichoic acid export membrane protein